MLISRHYKNRCNGRVSFTAAGPLALGCRESGQVGNEAATAECHRCRGQGSPFPLGRKSEPLAHLNVQQGLCPAWRSHLYSAFPLLFHSRQPFSSGKYSPNCAAPPSASAYSSS